MSVNVGDMFRHYRVVAKVGEGGMGVVYRAYDTSLGRDVALKFIVNGPRFSSELGDRLKREAQALARLNHPNILTIYEVGEADHTPFLALEWVGGGTLSDPSVGRPVSADQFFRLALPIAEALGAAHQR